MGINLYNETIEISEDLDQVLKKCFINHLLIYNYSLFELQKNPELTFKRLKQMITGYLREKKITPVLTVSLFNELYYQYKKFRSNIKTKKLITDIQYFTFISNGYTSDLIKVNENKTEIQLTGLVGKITCPPLPELTDDSQVLYFNISFSNISNQYKLSIFK